MNPTVDELMPTAVVNPSDGTTRQTLSAWPVVVAMAAYPLLKFALPFRVTNLVGSGVALSLAYLLAIYIYRGAAILASRERTWLLTLMGICMLTMSVLFSHSSQMWLSAVNIGMVVLAGAVVGRRSLTDTSQLRLYMLGLAVILVGGFLMFAPQWSGLMRLASEVSENVCDSLRSSMVAAGYHAEVADAFADKSKSIFNVTVRLLPAAMVMNIIVQYSIGFLWFLSRGAPDVAAVGKPRPFISWKMPFALTPLLVVTILGRLLGSDTVALVADNVLAAISIFYCVTGLALLEHFLGRLRVSLVLKVVFYIVLTLSGLFGYISLVMLGFIDSFADWRKVSGGINLDKTK